VIVIYIYTGTSRSSVIVIYTSNGTIFRSSVIDIYIYINEYL